MEREKSQSENIERLLDKALNIIKTAWDKNEATDLSKQGLVYLAFYKGIKQTEAHAESNRILVARFSSESAKEFKGKVGLMLPHMIPAGRLKEGK